MREGERERGAARWWGLGWKRREGENRGRDREAEKTGLGEDGERARTKLAQRHNGEAKRQNGLIANLSSNSRDIKSYMSACRPTRGREGHRQAEGQAKGRGDVAATVGVQGIHAQRMAWRVRSESAARERVRVRAGVRSRTHAPVRTARLWDRLAHVHEQMRRDCKQARVQTARQACACAVHCHVVCVRASTG